jgi:L-aminopeptidase/D-esterase-like protein
VGVLSITSVPGIKLGHAHDEKALTGCTVVLCEKGAVAGVDQRGGAPGTRETDLLRPMHLVEKVHALLLTGGSAYGLDAATGVMRYLEEKDIGYDVQVAKVPIVPAAVLFDLALGSAEIRPDASMGYEACCNASTDPPEEGNAGAGMGASVGKIFGMAGAVKSGIGTAAVDLGGGVYVGAVVAVNAFGDVLDTNTGKIIAGARPAKIGPVTMGGDGIFADTLSTMKSTAGKVTLKIAMKANTVIGVVATNAKLTKEEANKVAQMSQDGLARTVRPAHTMLDGDTIFACSTGSKNIDVNIIGSYAAEMVACSIIRAVQQAQSLGDLPAAADLMA